MLYGGAVSWPFLATQVKREYEEAQGRDDQPLLPGETHEYVVFTNEDAGLRLSEKRPEPLLWHADFAEG